MYYSMVFIIMNLIFCLCATGIVKNLLPLCCNQNL